MKPGFVLSSSFQAGQDIPDTSLFASHPTAPRFNAPGGFFILEPKFMPVKSIILSACAQLPALRVPRTHHTHHDKASRQTAMDALIKGWTVVD